MSDDPLRRFFRAPPPNSGRASEEQGPSPLPPPSSGPYPDSSGADSTAERSAEASGGDKQSSASVAPVWIGQCLRIAGEAANPSLIFRQRGGEQTALSYGYLSSARFDPQKGITLQFLNSVVELEGQRLAPVFEAIASHTALMVAEAGSEFDADPKHPFVRVIAIVATQER